MLTRFASSCILVMVAQPKGIINFLQVVCYFSQKLRPNAFILIGMSFSLLIVCFMENDLGH